MNYVNKLDFMKIVQNAKDTGALGKANSRRDEHIFPVVPTDSIFTGETQSKILILHKLQQERLQQTRTQQHAIIQG